MLTPVDVETTVFRRGFRGYNTREVQIFMEKICQDYEKLYKDNIDLREKIEELTKKLSQYQTIEDTLRNTMILAEETAEEAKSNAKQQADLIVLEAEQKAEAIRLKVKEEIQSELRNLALLKNQSEYFRCQFKSFLTGLLDMAEKQLDINIDWEPAEKTVAVTKETDNTASNSNDNEKAALLDSVLNFKATG